MTLEDFFTLAEMNNGLMAPARVKELIVVMQKEKDCLVKNIGDASRQWSAVASAIAATENKDCLDLFIQLDGLCYLSRWLKDAETFGNKTRDSSLQDSITDILQALERLHVDNDRSISSGIWMTVRKLLSYNSSKVQDRAKALLNNWKNEKEKIAALQGIEKVGTLADERTGVTADHVEESVGPSSSCTDINACRGSFNLEKQDEASKDCSVPMGSETLEAEGIKDAQNRSLKDAIINKEKSHYTDSSSSVKPANENLHIICHSEDAASTGTCSSAGYGQGVQEGQMYAPETESTDDVEQTWKPGSSSDKFDKIEISKSALSTDGIDALESATVPGTMKNNNAVERDFESKVSSSDCLQTVVSDPKRRMDNDISSSYCRSSIAFRTKEDGECNSDILQESNTGELKLENSKGFCTLFSRNENDAAVEGVQKESSDQGEGGLREDHDISKPRMLSKHHAIGKSDVELDYSTVDPLEVTRQVTIEVEREVESDCREQRFSSSKKELGSKVQQHKSPHSVSGQQCQTDESSPAGGPTGPDPSAVHSQVREDPTTSAGNLEAEPISITQDAESSQLTEAAQEVEAHTKKGPRSDFDLNQEVCSEDIERPISPPISVVSASRASAAPGMPISPLQFQGTLGWKGSVAMSAFQAASPCRVPEDDATPVGGSNGRSKQILGILDIDLNIAESEDYRITDLKTGKQMPVSSCLASWKSSVEGIPRKSQRLELDLNQVSDDGDILSDWQPEEEPFHCRNGHHSHSPSSSSSKQSSLRNIDLNDQPTFSNILFSDHGNSKSSQNSSASGGMKSDESVVSIMGMRVEVSRKDSAARILSLPDGRTSEPAPDVNLARTGTVLGVGSPVPYLHPPLYGYNSVSATPALPFSSPVYGHAGPIPYMFDSRVTPIVPQIMGSSSALPAAFPQPPFMFAMTAAPGSNRYDLNLGSTLDGANRESGGLRQLFNPGQARFMDEHLKSSNPPPSSSSGSGVKRKEPNDGWEAYPFKHHSQSWI